ncbi:polysaccharide biosynthesis C-terminal domain-containing protein [Amorphoplanes nipponensis]|uniref:Polysaccharide biosynthesis protein n=1 Tax=Actinoplanes nipponensis TaxID=135950 RepID=A0A919JJ20_9ACTN|nr:oligosaccharide flippase family protein [Actinoplanes nipponensis]GIE51658.1 polysaccharide biosynthesis protein [Actinoplanes nipponensis]
MTRTVKPPVVDHQLSRLFGRDSLYMVLWAVQLLGAAILTPVITRVLGSGEFGVVASCNAVMQVLFVVGGFGLQTAIQRQHELPHGRRDAAKVLAVSVALTASVTVAALGTVAFWARPLDMLDQLVALRISVVWAGLSAITGASLALLRSQERLPAFAAVSLFQSVVAEAASLGLIAWQHPSAENFLAGQTVAQLAAMVLGLMLAPPRSIDRRDLPMVADAVRFAVPLVPAVLGTFVLSTADRLLIQGAMGEDAVARYQVAYNVASMPLLLLSVLHSTWMPRFFALADGENRIRVLAASRDILYRLLVPLLIGFAAGTPLILRVWAPPSYRPESLSMVVLLVVVTAVPFAAHLAVSRALTARDRTADIAVCTLVAAAANVALNIWWIPRFGLEGSAAATLVAYCLLSVVLTVRARRWAPVPASDWRLRLQLAVAVAVAIATVELSADGALMWVRAAIVAATITWFARIVLPVVRR